MFFRRPVRSTADQSIQVRSSRAFSQEGFVKKVFHFESSREKYLCDAAILWCFDSRFELGFRKFLKRSGVTNSDSIKVAGGAKCLASPNHTAEREFVLEQIRISIELHSTRRVILMVHSDCGAYGGLAAFHNDSAAEAAHHETELRRAAANLTAVIPGLEILGYFVDFEGIWDAGISAVEKAGPPAVA
jgi:carbonic anhydrase